ncbi:semaphorin-4E isoform X2 [Hoplias malabaricus]
MEGKLEEGKGKCPFDPFQSYSSVMVDGDLYSATVFNFMGSEPIIFRSSHSILRTELMSSWLNEPRFVYMDMVPESVDSPQGDDDKIYVFFSEIAVEYDFYSKLIVSRVARVCKGDRGGQRTLQKKWTSFLKASINCPIPGSLLPSVVQDAFLVHNGDWKKNIFYAIFTSQPASNDVSSAVCAYSVSDINEVFANGKYKTPLSVDASHVKWVMYTGDPPVPRPGACINNEARASGIQSSLELPDKTLQFIRDRPLMDNSVEPITGGPMLVRNGITFTRIVVDRTVALDGKPYEVMFIGTDSGYVQKAVNYKGEMHIIVELQVFQSPEPVTVLRLSTNKGQLYAGSSSGVVQMPVADCSRYSLCLDCVLARDPYCAWDLSSHRCTSLSHSSKNVDLVQSLHDGDASRCPDPEPVVVRNGTLVVGNNIRLSCQQDSNLAQVSWHFAGQPLNISPGKYTIYNDDLFIYNASASDVGHYTCVSVERVVSRQYRRTLAAYDLHLVPDEDKDLISVGTKTEKPPRSPTTTAPNTAVHPSFPQQYKTANVWVATQVALGVVCVLMVALLLWNLYKGHLTLQKCRPQHRKLPQCDSVTSHQTSSSHSSGQLVISLKNNQTNGTRTDSFKHTIDESEI